MMITEEKRKIDLHLPTGWNRCTTEELEHIALAIINEQQRVDRYHPFDWSRVKLSIVLSINEITISEELRVKSEKFASATDAPTRSPSAISHQPIPADAPTRSLSDIESTWLVRRPQDKEPWPITTGQLVALTERLAWIDDEKASRVIFQFPYPTLDVRCKKEDVRAISHHPSSIIHLQGPPPLMDGYTWQEYRLLTDWMQAYMRHSNALLQVKSEELRVKTREAMAQAQREFLAILFKPAGKPTGAGIAVANSQLSTLNSQLFEGFSPIKWQVILFWWSSLMSMLAKKFPKVFKQQPVGKGKRRPQQQDTPWDFYNRVTATIQKYIGGLSEQDVNNATYGTILQQLEMMAQESAEMEKIRKSHK